MTTIQVGSVVRCRRRSSLDRSPLGLAVVATIATTAKDEGQEKDRSAAAEAPPKKMTKEHSIESACLLFEPYWPQPISPCISRDYLIIPKKVDPEPEQEEVTINNIQDIHECLPFERNFSSGHDSLHSSTPLPATPSCTTWKDYGDQLLRLGDPSAAASYYERALFESSCISIGGTIIVNVDGFPKLADVDCIEGNTVDITILESGEEQSVKKSSVLLGIMGSDPGKVQERTLLNLARCMVQLSDMDIVNRVKYLKSAVLATTLVVTISSFQRDEKEQQFAQESSSSLISNNAQTALIIRAKAQIGLAKWPQAKQDATKLVKVGNEQGQKLLSTIDRKKKLQVKTDKKLAKEMCRLVQSSTTNSVRPQNDVIDVVSSSEEEDDDTSTTASSSLSSSYHTFAFSHISFVLYYLIVPLMIAVLTFYIF
jgi:hypothetical protein